MTKIDYKSSFQNGVFHIGDRRIIDYKFYTKYTYFLPDLVIDAIYEVEEYFEKLDNFDEKLKNIDKYRIHPHEFVDTASIIYSDIRKHFFSQKEPIVLGSGFLSPVAWAYLGKNNTTFAKHYFRKFSDFLDYYMLQIQEEQNFGKLSIYQRSANNQFIELSRKTKFSINWIVSISILFLKDLIENCGPDCGYFVDIFTNNRNHNYLTAIPSWKEIREIIEKGFPAFITTKHYFSDIEIEEKISFPLCSTEKVYSFYGEKTKK